MLVNIRTAHSLLQPFCVPYVIFKTWIQKHNGNRYLSALLKETLLDEKLTITNRGLYKITCLNHAAFDL